MAHDLCGPSQNPLHPARTLVFSGVTGVQPQVAEALGQTVTRGDIQQELDALPILDFRTMNPSFEHQTLRVYQQVPFSSFDLLGSVVTARFAAYARGLDRLAIHYRGTGLRVPLQAHSHASAQGGVHPFPRPVQAPEAEVVVDRFPRWEVVRQQSPGTATLEHVEDGVKDLAQRIDPRTPVGFRSRKVRFQAAPFGVGEVGLVCFSHDSVSYRASASAPLFRQFQREVQTTPSPRPEALTCEGP